MGHPILYSFRRCPYAIRARLALYACNVTVEIREVSLKNKPIAMLKASQKGTVPVLIANNGKTIDESLDIMHWALQKSERTDWLSNESLTTTQAEQLIHQNDNEFKYFLDRYKYFDRYPEHSQDYYLQKALPFLIAIEEILSKHKFLSGSEFRFTDAAIAPFIRQFYMVDQPRFKQLNLSNIDTWLSLFLTKPLFKNIMEKYPVWQQGDEITLFANLN